MKFVFVSLCRTQEAKRKQKEEEEQRRRKERDSKKAEVDKLKSNKPNFVIAKRSDSSPGEVHSLDCILTY